MCYNAHMNSFATIMSWNFLEGGTVRARTGIPVSDDARVAHAQSLISDLQPDVLVLNEALWCAPWEGHVRSYAQMFGFAFESSHLYDKHWGNTILSKHPIVHSQGFHIYNRGGAVVTIDVGGQHIQVGTYHPHPSRYPHNKADDFLRVTQLFDRALPNVLAGDFNAIHPDDQIDEAQLLRGFASFSKNPEQDMRRFIDAGQAIFPVLDELGWRDAVTDSVHTIPTAMLGGGLDSAMRIDHLLVNAQVDVLEGRVVHDVRADGASDHYPILARLLISP